MIQGWKCQGSHPEQVLGSSLHRQIVQGRGLYLPARAFQAEPHRPPTEKEAPTVCTAAVADLSYTERGLWTVA